MRAFTDAERAAIGELWAVAGVCATSEVPALADFTPFVIARINQIVLGAVQPLMPTQAQM